MNTERGFSLVELLIVVSIIGLLTAISVPVYHGAKEKAQVAVFDTQVAALHDTAEMYLLDCGTDTTWAPTAGDRGMRDASAPHDAWGRYLSKWPENPLKTGDFVVSISGGEIAVSPGRDE